MHQPLVRLWNGSRLKAGITKGEAPTVKRSISESLHRLRRFRIRWKERLQRQLRQGDLDRRAEYGGRAEKAQHAIAMPQLERHDHAGAVRLVRPRWRWI